MQRYASAAAGVAVAEELPLRARASSEILRTQALRKIFHSGGQEIAPDVVAGKADTYQAYRSPYRLCCSNNAAVQELRPRFTMDGIEPDGLLSVTEEFREQVLSLAKANPAAGCGLTLPAASNLGH